MPSTTAMLKEAFFDTNLFLYAYSRAEEDRDKREHAREIFGQFRPVISPQVIQEFIAAALRKPIMGINESKLDEFLSLCAVYRLQPLTLNDLLYATALRRRFSLSHWDSSILAAAHASGCFILFSEDLQHGFQLDHLRIVNPFK
jgi:predicted nucleic acid-binding protein